MKRSIHDVMRSNTDLRKPEKPIFLSKSQRRELTDFEFRRKETSRKQSDQSLERSTQPHDLGTHREQSRLEAESMVKSELEAIKSHYLGSNKPNRRIIKPSEQYKFSFDWENTEDTSRDVNPLYQIPRHAPILFGRGFFAGIDRVEQKKLAVKHESTEKMTYDSFDMRVEKHWKKKRLEEMTERDWRIFREDFNISFSCRGSSRIPHPIRSWEESGLSRKLLKAIEEARYKSPSPIQMVAIPLGLRQRDVIGIAQTGSGKTAAFVLPMLSYISRLPPMTDQNKADGPYAIVLAPTRELALQIERETLKFASYLNIKVVSIVGGHSIEEQGSRIERGCQIVIATPGRLLDCLERCYVVLNQCKYVVLDEADRMIGMGFEQQVVGILDAMPSTNLKPENEFEVLDKNRVYRITYMFSATMSPAVEQFARKYLRNPGIVTIGTPGKIAESITQRVFMMKESEKFPRLQKLLDDFLDNKDKTAIIFVNTKPKTDFLSKSLEKTGYCVTTLHSSKSQEQRNTNLENFRAKRLNVLVATDVIGRGIDIPDVSHVINYDMPSKIDTYTHRIGRTGRAGKSGVATTFLTFKDSDVFYDLKQMLVQTNSHVPLELSRHEASKFKAGAVSDRSSKRYG